MHCAPSNDVALWLFITIELLLYIKNIMLKHTGIDKEMTLIYAAQHFILRNVKEIMSLPFLNHFVRPEGELQ